MAFSRSADRGPDLGRDGRVVPTVPAKNVKELIAIARRKASYLSYGSSGTGTIRADIPRYAKIVKTAGIKID